MKLKDEFWRVMLQNTQEEGPVLDEWLKRSLWPPHTYYLGHHLRVMIVAPTRRDAFKVGEWAAHRNPLGKKLGYSVIGYKGAAVVYLSYCPYCRDQKIKTPHHLHSRGEKPA